MYRRIKMTLKTEIDKSNKLKEDLKLAKENINARILSGGVLEQIL